VARRRLPAAGFADFDGFDAWLRADPVNRDDELLLLDRLERGNIHDVVRGAGQQIQLTVWPEEFIISPDLAGAENVIRPGRGHFDHHEGNLPCRHSRHDRIAMASGR
jgi:hypothetical protein